MQATKKQLHIERGKRKMRKNQIATINIFLLLLFYMEELISC